MGQSIAKDPNYPLKHAQITELKDTRKIAEAVRDSDIVIIRNGDTVGYLVNPDHYEALVAAAQEAGQRATETFLANRARRLGTLESLDTSYAAARRGEWASDEDENRAFDGP